MKRVIRIFLVVIGAVLLLVTSLIVLIILSPQGRIRLPVEQKAVFSHPEIEDFPTWISTKGTHLTTPNGTAVRLVGVMPSDPYVLHGRNRFNRNLFRTIRSQGANVVRIPVHPEYWQKDPQYLWRYLDKAVAWAGEADLYIIIDWHSIGNVKTGFAPLMPELYSHTYQMTLDFWSQTAAYFKDAPNVLFEIFNEPQSISSSDWHTQAENIISVIRAQGARQPVIVGGIEYARDLSWVLDKPVEDSNLIYAAHIYPVHTQYLWPRYFGEVAKQYPVIITEWGFMDENSQEQAPYLAGDADKYGDPLINYLDSLEIGWVACWYDDEWLPPMFSRGFSQPTRFGEFVLSRLTPQP